MLLIIIVASSIKMCYTNAHSVANKAHFFTTFELQLTKVGRIQPCYCVLIYQPSGPAGLSLSEFTDFLTSLIKLDKVIC